MNDINKIKAALIEAFTNAMPIKQSDKTVGGGSKKQKTKRGALHKIGRRFRQAKVIKMTPAQYRRQHEGVVTITPNYLKPHPAPRWRNKWISE